MYVVVIDLSFFLHSKYMFIDNISFNNQLLYSNIKSLSYTQWVGKLHFINSIQASLREMNISVIFFWILERGTKTYFFYQFLLEIFQQMYIAYSWMLFLSADTGYILTMALRIVKSGYLKRFSSRSLTVVFKEYHSKLIYDTFFINYQYIILQFAPSMVWLFIIFT